MRQHNLGWFSSYDRGLMYLLFMWEDIRKKFPDATLHVAYGWDTFMKIASNNPERMEWKKKMDKLMQQEGIIHHGRLNKAKLKALRNKCGILAYSTDFFEINCITVLECQAQGCVPVVMNQEFILDDGSKTKTALDETVYSGVKVAEDIRTPQGRELYLSALTLLMENKEYWKKLSREGIAGAKKYKWEKTASKWATEFESKVSEPKVTIITPTIRKGFWNIMSDNISKQTYKNIEWMVVDDYPEDRVEIMGDVCAKYNIMGRYARGDKGIYHYGLSTANNVGWQQAEGELLVWLQDFMLIPPQGIEALVDIYRHNPNVLIAPTDINCVPSVKPDVESEDWFNGQTNVVGEVYFDNPRNLKIGMRESRNPFEFEMNYAAVPKKIVEAVGGWYEFFNDALGFDNTEFAFRAMSLGYKMIVDDTNQAVGLNHWEALKDKPEELGEKRTHRLNDPRYYWMLDMLKEGKLPLKRDPLKDGFRLDYEIPEKLSQDEAVTWMKDNMEKIIKSWKDKI